MCKVNDFMLILLNGSMYDNGVKGLILIDHDIIGSMLNIKLMKDINLYLSKLGVVVTIF
jgi:hypothetical protein